MVPSLDVCQTFCVDRFVDGGLAKYAGPLVHDSRLSGCYTLDRLIKFHLPHHRFGPVDVTGGDAGTTGYRFCVCPDLNMACKPCAGDLLGNRGPCPGCPDPGTAVNSKHVACTDHYGIIFRTNFQHETRFTIFCWFADGQSATLTAGEGLSARVSADLFTAGVIDRAVFHVDLFF